MCNCFAYQRPPHKAHHTVGVCNRLFNFDVIVVSNIGMACGSPHRKSVVYHSSEILSPECLSKHEYHTVIRERHRLCSLNSSQGNSCLITCAMILVGSFHCFPLLFAQLIHPDLSAGRGIRISLLLSQNPWSTPSFLFEFGVMFSGRGSISSTGCQRFLLPAGSVPQASLSQ